MVSLICPVYNEEKYIKNVLGFYTHSAYPEKEIIFIDGLSDDRTTEIIKDYCLRDNSILLLQNADKYVPFALNKALHYAKGNIIIRIDAHTEYAQDYIECVLQVFEKTDADIVGGAMRIAKGNDWQNVIGYTTSTWFGIGNSSFHFADFEGYTDTVYLGAWKKSVFEKAGLFDESFIRNQDDEFHYRAKKMGLTIYQSPAIKLYYHPRSSLLALFNQYFQYGLYKPAVLKKVNGAVKWRHVFPSLFVLYLIILPFFFKNNYFQWLLFPLFIYIIINLYFSMSYGRNVLQQIKVFITYFILHIAYGTGFIAGLFKAPNPKAPNP